MSGFNLHDTPIGKKFYCGDVPRIVKALERIADSLEKLNKNEEDKIKIAQAKKGE